MKNNKKCKEFVNHYAPAIPRIRRQYESALRRLFAEPWGEVDSISGLGVKPSKGGA